MVYGDSIDAQWVVAKKDWKEAKKKQEKQQDTKDAKKEKERSPEVVDPADPASGKYQQDMDEMRCILYAHGGVFDLVDISDISQSHLS